MDNSHHTTYSPFLPNLYIPYHLCDGTTSPVLYDLGLLQLLESQIVPSNL